MADSKLKGMLISYRDDQIEGPVRMALRGKSRVRYRCMDTFAHFLAFGTSSGAVYLYRLDVVSHSTCSLISMIPCDQGSIEVIKFLPSQKSEDLLIAIGTSRGSIVILRLFQSPREQSAYCDEIYKAECFTENSQSIKLIESDQDLLDQTYPFSRLYICDSADQLYVLDSDMIFSNNNGLRLFRRSHPPISIRNSHIKNSRINQISVHRSHLLISTDETTKLFNVESNRLNLIGKKKRDPGFYGACFFDPNHKPNNLSQPQQQQQQSRQASFSSLTSLNELDSLLIFVARPMFRMWQVNYRCDVMFTHQFGQLLGATKYTRIVELDNIPLDENQIDDPMDAMECFELDEDKANDSNGQQAPLKSDHFHKLIPIYSSTLGNLLLSHDQHKLFIIDPIRAELVTWCSFRESIKHLRCNENEIFIWCQTVGDEHEQFHLKRLVLLAPTQFVLELHRLHRYLTLVVFVQQFSELFRNRMALPLSGPNIITTEGGLLRNILLNAWDVVNQWRNTNDNNQEWLSDLDTYCAEFKRLVEQIIDESNQLKSSLDNLTDSRFFLAIANENIDRLLSEPYASLVSLEVSIAELHTSHVIHFSREAINRHKSVANLSQNLRSVVYEAKNRTRSTMDLSNSDCKASNMPSKSMRDLTNTAFRSKKAQVIVERQRPKRNPNRFAASRYDRVVEDSIEEQSKEPTLEEATTFFSVKSAQENRSSPGESIDSNNGLGANGESGESNNVDQDQIENEKKFELFRCKVCRWPKSRGHLEPLNGSQSDQVKWIEENLTTNFFENIDLIEERAFKYSLWSLFLKCLAFKRQIDDYITCCMLLDDVRLLDIEQLVIICSGEDEMMNLLLTHLNRKMEIQETIESSSASDDNNPRKSSGCCLRCEKEYEPSIDDHSDNNTLNVPEDHKTESSATDEDDEFGFNLANLLNQFIKRNNSNIKKMVSHSLNYTKLLNNSKIPVGFYLRAIEKTINLSKRPKKSSLLSQDSSFWNSNKAF